MEYRTSNTGYGLLVLGVVILLIAILCLSSCTYNVYVTEKKEVEFKPGSFLTPGYLPNYDPQFLVLPHKECDCINFPMDDMPYNGSQFCFPKLK